MNMLVPLVVLLVGGSVYGFTNGKPSELGRIAFFVGPHAMGRARIVFRRKLAGAVARGAGMASHRIPFCRIRMARAA
jgi:hypothetical protein